MAELMALSPCAGLLPVTHGDWTLSEVEAGHLTWLSPFKGQAAALGAALQKAHGLDWPAVGQVSTGKDACCFWSGRDQAMLMGPAPDKGLRDHAAVSDQSDGWAVLRLTGAQGAEVLARLMPVDLRPVAFPVGSALRTQCQHVNVMVLRESAEAIVVLGFRSMSQTLVHEIAEAMVSVAAQGQAD
ncbi:sarcosine oxidase subunit gamma [Tropicibacter oceani]|uniref:Sarcosine oxidase subunit gamma family protein n=1 Tax=Tropicibacter oceani TaxID=3058420 RepID=A0ABY8QHC2_9RHOB|nr:sarcosine oxidase subunit gamma family protein [Tropicibacter oceani]WGW03838.1 sarcosine oxidase subunit gamma family protein [Tropicibacter oceani]